MQAENDTQDRGTRIDTESCRVPQKIRLDNYSLEGEFPPNTPSWSEVIWFGVGQTNKQTNIRLRKQIHMHVYMYTYMHICNICATRIKKYFPKIVCIPCETASARVIVVLKSYTNNDTYMNSNNNNDSNSKNEWKKSFCISHHFYLPWMTTMVAANNPYILFVSQAINVTGFVSAPDFIRAFGKLWRLWQVSLQHKLFSISICIFFNDVHR